MALSAAKREAIHRAEEKFLRDEEDRYNEFVFELAMQLGLEESTVRKVLGVD